MKKFKRFLAGLLVALMVINTIPEGTIQARAEGLDTEAYEVVETTETETVEATEEETKEAGIGTGTETAITEETPEGSEGESEEIMVEEIGTYDEGEGVSPVTPALVASTNIHWMPGDTDHPSKVGFSYAYGGDRTESINNSILTAFAYKYDADGDGEPDYRPVNISEVKIETLEGDASGCSLIKSAFTVTGDENGAAFECAQLSYTKLGKYRLSYDPDPDNGSTDDVVGFTATVEYSHIELFDKNEIAPENVLDYYVEIKKGTTIYAFDATEDDFVFASNWINIDVYGEETQHYAIGDAGFDEYVAVEQIEKGYKITFKKGFEGNLTTRFVNSSYPDMGPMNSRNVNLRKIWTGIDDSLSAPQLLGSNNGWRDDENGNHYYPNNMNLSNAMSHWELGISYSLMLVYWASGEWDDAVLAPVHPDDVTVLHNGVEDKDSYSFTNFNDESYPWEGKGIDLYHCGFQPLKTGDYTIIYDPDNNPATDNSVEYSVEDVILPQFGFYSENRISEDTALLEQDGSKYETVYFLINTDRAITRYPEFSLRFYSENITLYQGTEEFGRYVQIEELRNSEGGLLGYKLDLQTSTIRNVELQVSYELENNNGWIRYLKVGISGGQAPNRYPGLVDVVYSSWGNDVDNEFYVETRNAEEGQNDIGISPKSIFPLVLEYVYKDKTTKEIKAERVSFNNVSVLLDGAPAVLGRDYNAKTINAINVVYNEPVTLALFTALKLGRYELVYTPNDGSESVSMVISSYLPNYGAYINNNPGLDSFTHEVDALTCSEFYIFGSDSLMTPIDINRLLIPQYDMNDVETRYYYGDELFDSYVSIEPAKSQDGTKDGFKVTVKKSGFSLSYDSGREWAEHIVGVYVNDVATEGPALLFADNIAYRFFDGVGNKYVFDDQFGWRKFDATYNEVTYGSDFVTAFRYCSSKDITKSTPVVFDANMAVTVDGVKAVKGKDFDYAVAGTDSYKGTKYTIYSISFKKTGRYVFTYKGSKVIFDVVLPDFGLYTSTEPSTETYVSAYQIDPADYEDNTLYLYNFKPYGADNIMAVREEELINNQFVYTSYGCNTQPDEFNKFIELTRVPDKDNVYKVKFLKGTGYSVTFNSSIVTWEDGSTYAQGWNGYSIQETVNVSISPSSSMYGHLEYLGRDNEWHSVDDDTNFYGTAFAVRAVTERSGKIVFEKDGFSFYKDGKEQATALTAVQLAALYSEEGLKLELGKSYDPYYWFGNYHFEWDSTAPQIFYLRDWDFNGEKVTLPADDFRKEWNNYVGQIVNDENIAVLIAQTANNKFAALNSDKYVTSDDGLTEPGSWTIKCPDGGFLAKPAIGFEGKATGITYKGAGSYTGYEIRLNQIGDYLVLYNAGTASEPVILEAYLTCNFPDTGFYSEQRVDVSTLMPYGQEVYIEGGAIYAFANSHDNSEHSYLGFDEIPVKMVETDFEKGESWVVDLSKEELEEYVVLTPCTDISDSDITGFKVEFTPAAVGHRFVTVTHSINRWGYYDENGEFHEEGCDDNTWTSREIEVKAAKALLLEDWFDFDYDEFGEHVNGFGHNENTYVDPEYGTSYDGYAKFDREDLTFSKGGITFAIRYRYMKEDGSIAYIPVSAGSDKVSVTFTEYGTNNTRDLKAGFIWVGCGNVTADELMPSLDDQTYEVSRFDMYERGTVTISYENPDGEVYSAYIYIEPQKYRLGSDTECYEYSEGNALPWTSGDFKLYLWVWDDNANDGRGAYVKATKATLDEAGATLTVRYASGPIDYDDRPFATVTANTTEVSALFTAANINKMLDSSRNLGEDWFPDLRYMDVNYEIKSDNERNESYYSFINSSAVLQEVYDYRNTIGVVSGGTVTLNADLLYWVNIPSMEDKLNNFYNVIWTHVANRDELGNDTFFRYTVKSSDPSVVKVSYDVKRGAWALLEPVGIGKATISISYSGKTQYTFDVNVTHPEASGVFGSYEPVEVEETGETWEEFVPFVNNDEHEINLGNELVLNVNPKFNAGLVVPGSVSVTIESDNNDEPVLELWTDSSELMMSEVYSWLMDDYDAYDGGGYYAGRDTRSVVLGAVNTGKAKVTVKFNYKYTDARNAVKVGTYTYTTNVNVTLPTGTMVKEYYFTSEDGKVMSSTGQLNGTYIGGSNYSRLSVYTGGELTEDGYDYAEGKEPTLVKVNSGMLNIVEYHYGEDGIDKVPSYAFEAKVCEGGNYITLSVNTEVLADYINDPERNIYDTHLEITVGDETISLPIWFDERLAGTEKFTLDGYTTTYVDLMPGVTKTFEQEIYVPYSEELEAKLAEGTDIPVELYDEEAGEFYTVTAKVSETAKVAARSRAAGGELLKVKLSVDITGNADEFVWWDLAGKFVLDEEVEQPFMLATQIIEIPERAAEDVEGYDSIGAADISKLLDGTVSSVTGVFNEWIPEITVNGETGELEAVLVKYIGADTDELWMPSYLDILVYDTETDTMIAYPVRVRGFRSNVLGEAEIGKVYVLARYDIYEANLSSSKAVVFESYQDDERYDAEEADNNLFTNDEGILFAGGDFDDMSETVVLDIGGNTMPSSSDMPEADEAVTWEIKDTETGEDLYFVVANGVVVRVDRAGNLSEAELADAIKITSETFEEDGNTDYTRLLETYTTANGPVRVNYISREDGTVFSFFTTFTSTTKYVSFMTDEDTVFTTKTYKMGSAYGTLPVPTKTGYTFGGWITEDGKAVKPTDKITSDHDYNVYAKWTAKTYTVKFNANNNAIRNTTEADSDYYAEFGIEFTAETIKNEGSTTGSVADKKVTYDTEYEIPENALKRAGYVFVEWNTKADGTGDSYLPGDIAVNTADMTPAAPVVTLYAIWRPQVFVATLDYAGAQDNEEIFYIKALGSDIPTPSGVSGYDFKGWYKDNLYKTPMPKILAGTSGDITVYAKWVPASYTVKFVNGDVVKEQIVPYNVATELTTVGTKKGNKFTGWTFDAEGTEAAFADKAIITVDDAFIAAHTTDKVVTLYATWSDVYSVSFESNGGTTYPDTTYKYGEGKTFYGELPTPVKPGYTFGGWFTDATLKTAASRILVATAAVDVTLYAKWTVNVVNVTFNANKGTGSVKAQTYVYGEENALNPVHTIDAKTGKDKYALTRVGYVFAGWTTNADGTGKLFADAQAVTAVDITSEANTKAKTAITLYAKWIAIPYTVTFHINYPFDADGKFADETIGAFAIDEETATMTYTINATAVTELPKPVTDNPDYTFVDWYKDSTFKTVYKSIPKNTYTDIELYAKWTGAKYTVNFDGNSPEGTTVTGITRPAALQQGLPGALTKSAFKVTGHKFLGWSLKPQPVAVDSVIDETGAVVYKAEGGATVNIDYTDGELVTDILTDSADAEVTVVEFKPVLYAVWSTEYNITYVNNGGDAVGEVITKYNYGEGTSLPELTKTGYVFDGWFTDVKCTKKQSDGYTITTTDSGDKTLYAKFTAKKYTVQYDANIEDYNSRTNGNLMKATLLTYDAKEVALTKNSYKLLGNYFRGWAFDADAVDPDIVDAAKIKVTEDGICSATGEVIKSIDVDGVTEITLYAVWSDEYTVVFDSQGGTEFEATTYNYGEAGILAASLEEPEKTGYTFGGWYTEKACRTLATKAMTDKSAANYTLYAKWTAKQYKVNYDANIEDYNSRTNGNLMKATLLTYDAKEVALTKNSYKLLGSYFVGWAFDPDATEADIADVTKVSIKADGLYSVTGDKLGDMDVDTDTEITLYAIWSDEYTVVFDSQGGTEFEATTYTYGEAGILAASLEESEREGYIFEGWYTEKACRTLATKAMTDKSATNYTLYAKWTPITYYVMFVGNSTLAKTTKSTVLKMTYDKPLALTPNMYTATGNKFMGWSLNPGAVYTDELIEDKAKVSFTVADFDESTGYAITTRGVTTNYKVVKLYAVWTDTFNITYNTNGGDMPDSYIEDYTYGLKKYDALPVPERDGYTFAGWFADPAFKKPVKSITATSSGDLALNAKWTGMSYTVNFDANAPEGVKVTGKTGAIKLVYGTEKALTKNAFKIPGFTFLGWSRDAADIVSYAVDEDGAIVPVTSADAVEFYNANDELVEVDYANGQAVGTVSADGSYEAVATLYAVWAEEVYTIEWFAEGIDTSNEEVYPVEYTSRDTIDMPAPAKIGYTFGGWYIDAKCTRKAADIKAGSTGNRTFYAKWTLNK